jgi:hypothetical protein
VTKLHLGQGPGFGALAAYHKPVSQFDMEYASGFALYASEMFALEAHARCQEWYKELAQERERAEQARNEEIRREQERQQAVANQAYIEERKKKQQEARGLLPTIRSTCERYSQGYEANSWRGFFCQIRKREGKPDIAWHFNSVRRLNQLYSAWQEYGLLNTTFCDAYGKGEASVTISFPNPRRAGALDEKSEDC